MKRILFVSMAVLLGLTAGCTLDPNASDGALDLTVGCFDSQGNLISCDLKVPCDANNDGVVDCLAPDECRNATNTGDPVCADQIGITCREWDPANICAVPLVAACGDGNLDAGEVCDDGNVLDGDGCSANCLSDESCGNSILDAAAGETCDDGNIISGDGCSATCLSEACGNSVIDAGEACDDGNNTDGDGCSANCLSLEVCGNSITDAPVGEVCDDGNIISGDGCSANCLSDETCGNGIIDSVTGEVCDDGNNTAGDGCSADCMSDETCGNGTLDPGEACDDSNVVGGDGCSADCLSNESCGNGILDALAGEVCDDGNNLDGDGCNAACDSLEVCGNGVLDLGEECDDGNVANNDGCDSLCFLELCGNNTKDPGEDCDNGTDCNLSCACPANYMPDGNNPPGCAACDIGGVCQGPSSNYCAGTPACWASAVEVGLPNGGTIYVRTGAGLEFPTVVPAGQYRYIGLLATDLGAELWCSTNSMSVDTVFPAGFPAYPTLPGVWLPGALWPTIPGGPAALVNAPQFNVTSQTDAYWTLAP